MEQARKYATHVVQALEKDSRLLQPSGRYQGHLCFPWSYGVVLTGITRPQLEKSGLYLEPQQHVLCKDEMLERVSAQELQNRLWDMFPYGRKWMTQPLSSTQIDVIRWNVFPDVRVSLLPTTPRERQQSSNQHVPDIVRVMDLRQETVARSLGEGHRVIHGVAGSGKTMLLVFRAVHLAQSMMRTRTADGRRDILVVCYNKALAKHISHMMLARGVHDRVEAVNFHKWCRDQLLEHHLDLPDEHSKQDFYTLLVQRVINGVKSGRIPTGQYQAVLIDEGHDFEPEWFQLMSRMVDPATDSLLVLYDDAQRIYESSKNRRQFRFNSVGIQAQGRTTILKKNYRNTRQIHDIATCIAPADLILADKTGTDEDSIPQLKPVSCGREGEKPVVLCLPTLGEEAAKVSELLETAHHRDGYAWGDMAVLCRRNKDVKLNADALKRRWLPHTVCRNGPGNNTFDPSDETRIKVMTLHASKGLEFPVVVMTGVGDMPLVGRSEHDEACLFYVGATRATQRLIIGASGHGDFAKRLSSFDSAEHVVF